MFEERTLIKPWFFFFGKDLSIKTDDTKFLVGTVAIVATFLASNLAASDFIYHTSAIITGDLYFFNPLFEDEKRFFKELFS